LPSHVREAILPARSSLTPSRAESCAGGKRCHRRRRTPPARSCFHSLAPSARPHEQRPYVDVARQAGDQAVAKAILDGVAPYRRPDGSYYFKNTLRFAIGRKQ